jgi:copper homeostasis protein
VRPRFEICVEGIDGAIAAERGGADRAELCASLIEGGLTPGLGTIRATQARTTIPLHVMVRPRGGDFLYSDDEFAGMLEDVRAIRDTGVAAIVIGCLTAEGDVDAGRTGLLVQAARPLRVTFHRAFDMVRDADAALDALIACGVDRVLTSGLQPSALEGAAMLRHLHARAAGRIIIMGCGKLRSATIGAVVAQTGLGEFHFSAPRQMPSRMVYRNPAISMGGDDPEREYRIGVTDPELVRATIAAAHAA